MKILVTGSRRWTDQRFISDILWAFEAYSNEGSASFILVHGAADGADTIAARAAKSLGWKVRDYPANWQQHGPDAGPLRNQEMIDKEHTSDEPIDLCLAFPDEFSTGTLDQMARCKLAGIPVINYGVR